MAEGVKYAIITAARDEGKHIEATITCVARQTIPPAEWVMVDDGSTDSTGSIIDQYAGRFAWIHVVHRSNRGFRKAGGGVIEAFYDGYKALRRDDWEFVVKLDGDLTFSPRYFEQCLEHFHREPRLGIGGGEIYHSVGGEWIVEANPRFHVRGATKIYRRACWEAIGGLMAAPGWDTIDEVKANMLGWKTYSFTDVGLLHHRLTGAADGRLRDCVKHGVACYVSGYHPLFVAASCLYRLIQTPCVIGSSAIAYGFLKGYVTGGPRVSDRRLISYLRAQQLRRLCGLKTIWK
jgi:glycosyltransferase involved in cell wall biosynthesis